MDRAVETFAKETLPISLEDEMRRSYLDYAMSVIVGRALPDARDGLKPVHRRVLFAMHELGNDWNKPYKKYCEYTLLNCCTTTKPFISYWLRK